MFGDLDIILFVLKYFLHAIWGYFIKIHRNIIKKPCISPKLTRKRHETAK